MNLSLDQLSEYLVGGLMLTTMKQMKKIREGRGYSCVDFCEVFPEKLPNYEEKIIDFFEEHFHTDEEIRYRVAGSGYFDVRDHNDRWIRVWVNQGGMIILPAGIYHRFTLDQDDCIKWYITKHTQESLFVEEWEKLLCSIIPFLRELGISRKTAILAQ